MTSLAVTLSVDARGPSALYIITDSRITWDSSSSRWDAGQKTFASARTADVFGFCGDAFFPPAILRQIIDQIDAGLILPDGMDADDRHAVVLNTLKSAIALRVGVPMQAFAVLHGAREGELMGSRFRVWETRYSEADGWRDEEKDVDSSQSYLVHLDGSGKRVIDTKRKDWIDTSAEGTSRAAIWAFCDALHSGKDPYSGGPPQLVGLWRKGPARTFGFLWHGNRYFSGLEVTGGVDWTAVARFNHLFERCDGRSGSRMNNAQRQPKPVLDQTK